jgi:hypothetical protein
MTRARSHRRARSLALLPGVIAFLVTVAPAHAVTSAQIISTINAERKANGIPSVTENAGLSAGCAQYNRYREMNGSLGNAFTPGAEKSSLPGYTAAGARASHDSLLNAGSTPDDTWANGDVFDSAPGHLVALMDPAVAVVGADQLDFSAGVFGTASLTCVDVRSAPGRKRPVKPHGYLYRGPNGKVPLNPTYREGPPGHDPYLFLYFLAPAGAHLSLKLLKITTLSGAPVKLTYVRFSGGLIDARHGGNLAQAANGTSPSTTETVTMRQERLEAEEKLKSQIDEIFNQQLRKLKQDTWWLFPGSTTVWH